MEFSSLVYRCLVDLENVNDPVVERRIPGLRTSKSYIRFLQMRRFCWCSQAITLILQWGETQPSVK